MNMIKKLFVLGFTALVATIGRGAVSKTLLGVTKSYTYIFRGTDTTNPNNGGTLANWYTGTTNSWSAVTSGSAPGVTGNYDSMLFDGSLMENSVTETDKKTISCGTLEGWNSRIGAFNNVNLTIAGTKKLQNGCWWVVDETSNITLTTLGTTAGNSDGNTDLYVDAEDGIVFKNAFSGNGTPKFIYHLGTKGSVTFEQATGLGSHTISDVKMSFQAPTVKKVVRTRKLISYTGRTTTPTWSGVSLTPVDATTGTVIGSVTLSSKTSEVTTEDAVGTYFISEESTSGVTLTYVDYDENATSAVYTATIEGDKNWGDLSWQLADTTVTELPTNAIVKLTATATATLTLDRAITGVTCSLVDNSEEGCALTITANEGITADFTSIDATATTGAVTLEFATGSAAVTAGANTILNKTGSGLLTITEGKKATLNAAWSSDGTISNTGTLVYAYAVTGNLTSAPNATRVYAGGTAEGSTVKLAPTSGGTLKVEKGTYKLNGMENTSTSTNLIMDEGATLAFDDLTGGSTGDNVNNGFNLGTVNFTMNGGTITTPRFTLSQGDNGRTSTVIQKGGAITVTGATSEDSNHASIMFGHWNGPTTYTMNGGTFTAENAYVLVGKTNNDHTWTIGANATATVKGVMYAGYASGTNTLTVGQNGTLLLGSLGIDRNGKTVNFKVDGTLGTVTTNEVLAVAVNAPMKTSLGVTFDVKSAATTLTMSGAITDESEATTPSLTKIGEGTLVLSAANTYSGGTKVTAGTLNATAENALGSGDVTLSSGGTLKVTTASLGSKTITVVEGSTLQLQLTAQECLSDYSASTITVNNGATFEFLDSTGAKITEGVNGTSYTAPLNTWTATNDNNWSTVANWSKGTVPETTDSVKINVTADNTTLTIDTAAVTVGNATLLGTGSLTINGENQLSVTGNLLVQTDCVAAMEKLSAGAIDVATSKTLTLDSTTMVADPDTIPATLKLPTLTGAGTVKKTGAGALGIVENRSVDPTIEVVNGTLMVRYETSQQLTVVVDKDAEFRLASWSSNFANSLNSFTLKGGSRMVLANGPDKTVNGAVIIADATDDNPVKIQGSSFGKVTLATTISGTGTLEFADGGGFGDAKYPCENETTVSGVISGGVKVKVSDAQTITFSGVNTYTGGTEIVSGSVLAITNAGALGSGAITGAGTLSSSIGFPTNKTGLTTPEWTGTLKVTNNLTLSETDLAPYGSNVSTIELAGTNTGFLKKAGTCAANLCISGTTTISNGWSDDGGYTFSGKLTGNGTFATSGAQTDVLAFTGDVSGFTGTITVGGSHCVAIGTQTDDDTATGMLVIAAKNSAAIASGKTWTAVNGIKVAGTLGGTGTCASAVTFQDGSTLLSEGNTPLTTSAGVTATGTVTVALDEVVAAESLPCTLLSNLGTSTESSAFTLNDNGKNAGYILGKDETTKALQLTTRPMPATPEATEADPDPVPMTPAASLAVSKAANEVEGVDTITTITGQTNTGATDESGETAPTTLTSEQINTVLSVFDNVVTVTKDEGEENTGTAVVAYDFGISVITIKPVDGANYIVVTAKVAGEAKILPTAKVSITIQHDGELTEFAMEEVKDETATETGSPEIAQATRYFRLPYSAIQSTTGTYQFKVKAATPTETTEEE